MTDEEMFEKLDEIEIRKSRERTIKSYVLRNNVISDKDRKIISQYMPDHGFFFEDKMLDYSKLFGNDNPVVVEIGFGMGDTTSEIALRRPECNYIGIEVFLHGFVNLLNDLGK